VSWPGPCLVVILAGSTRRARAAGVKCPRRFAASDLLADQHFAEPVSGCSRGAAWFFHSDRRSEQFLNMRPLARA
jgi:hypothetical protein